MASDHSSRPDQLDGLGAYMINLPVAVYTTDAEGFVTHFNPAAEALAGRVPVIGQDRWCVTWRLYWPDGRRMLHEECPMATALKENRTVRGAEAIAERPDGSRFRFTPFPTPIRNAEGAVARGVNVLVDITNRGSTAENLRRALTCDADRKVTGILRVVQEILREGQQKARGTEARNITLLTVQRVAAIGAMHGLFHTVEGQGEISSWDLLSTICIAARVGMDESVELLCESAAGNLSNETAMPLALIAKELIENAARYGRSGRSKVLITVGLRKEPSGSYVLTVEDNGPGFELQSGHTRRFGLGLVVALARQLNGTFEVTRTPGASCTVRFPDPRRLH